MLEELDDLLNELELLEETEKAELLELEKLLEDELTELLDDDD